MPAGFATSPGVLLLTVACHSQGWQMWLCAALASISTCSGLMAAGSTQVDGPVQGRHVLWGWLQERRKVGSYDYAGCLSVPRLLFIRDNRLVQVSRREKKGLLETGLSFREIAGRCTAI